MLYRVGGKADLVLNICFEQNETKSFSPDVKTDYHKYREFLPTERASRGIWMTITNRQDTLNNNILQAKVKKDRAATSLVDFFNP